MSEQQTQVDNWIDKELKALNQTTNFDGEKLPALQFEENKIVEFAVDFSEPFKPWEDLANNTIKAIIPVTHKEEKKVLWLNKKNPLYRELIAEGQKGITTFKVLQVGTKQNTKYTLVKE